MNIVVNDFKTGKQILSISKATSNPFRLGDIIQVDTDDNQKWFLMSEKKKVMTMEDNKASFEGVWIYYQARNTNDEVQI